MWFPNRLSSICFVIDVKLFPWKGSSFAGEGLAANALWPSICGGLLGSHASWIPWSPCKRTKTKCCSSELIWCLDLSASALVSSSLAIGASRTRSFSAIGDHLDVIPELRLGVWWGWWGSWGIGHEGGEVRQHGSRQSYIIVGEMVNWVKGKAEDWCWDVPSRCRSDWIWGKGGDRDKQRWNGEVSERKAIQNLWWAAPVYILVFSIWIWDDLRPCVSARSFELSFGNFEPLDARSLSQCSSRTPLCFISGLIAMTQPDYISNSFNVFSAVLSKFMFFFRLEDLRQRFKTPLQRLWKGTGGVQAWNRQFCESAKFVVFVCFSVQKGEGLSNHASYTLKHAWKRNWIKSSEDSSLGFFPKQKLLLSVFQCLHLKGGQFNSGDTRVGVEHLHRQKVSKNISWPQHWKDVASRQTFSA